MAGRDGHAAVSPGTSGKGITKLMPSLHASATQMTADYRSEAHRSSIEDLQKVTPKGGGLFFRKTKDASRLGAATIPETFADIVEADSPVNNQESSKDSETKQVKLSLNKANSIEEIVLN
jgi:hypothetical protein